MTSSRTSVSFVSGSPKARHPGRSKASEMHEYSPIRLVSGSPEKRVGQRVEFSISEVNKISMPVRSNSGGYGKAKSEFNSTLEHVHRMRQHMNERYGSLMEVARYNEKMEKSCIIPQAPGKSMGYRNASGESSGTRELELEEIMLNKKKRQLTIRSSMADAKRLQRLQVLSQPLDSLGHEESIVSCVCADVDDLASRFEKIRAVVSNEELVANTNNLELSNERRRALINARRDALNDQRLKGVSCHDVSDVVSARNLRLKAQAELETTKTEAFLDGMSAKLARHRTELQEDEGRADVIHDVYNEIREKVMREWKEKLRRTKVLKEKAAEVETLIANIAEMSTAVDVTGDRLHDLSLKSGQLRRTVHNLKRDKSRNLQDNSMIAAMRKRLREKDALCSRKEQRLRECCRQIDREERQVDELEIQMRRMEDSVRHHEAKTEELSRSVDATVAHFRHEQIF